MADNNMNTAIMKKVLRSNIFMAGILSIALLVAGHFISPGFASLSNIMTLMIIAAFLGIITLAQTIVMITDSGGIDLSVGSILQYAMVVIAQMCSKGDHMLVPSIIFALATCTLFGLANGLGTVLLKIPPLIMTLSMGSVVIGFTLLFVGGFPDGMAARSLIKFVYGETLGLPNMVLTWIGIIAAVVFVMAKTKVGRIMYGVGANRLTAEMSGVNTLKVRILAYTLAGLVSGVSGTFLLGYMAAPNNLETGAGYVMPSIAAAVVGGVSLSGGKGNYGGAALGVIFLTILEALLMTIQLGEPVRKIIYGGVVIGILVSYVIRNKK